MEKSSVRPGIAGLQSADQEDQRPTIPIRLSPIVVRAKEDHSLSNDVYLRTSRMATVGIGTLAASPNATGLFGSRHSRSGVFLVLESNHLSRASLERGGAKRAKTYRITIDPSSLVRLFEASGRSDDDSMQTAKSKTLDRTMTTESL